jgi:TnpA family transposase
VVCRHHGPFTDDDLGPPRQHELAVALREIGRVERTLFIIEWLLDVDMQRRAQIGLNKGEAHHALKNALRIGR